jgi:hypothetical protein
MPLTRKVFATAALVVPLALTACDITHAPTETDAGPRSGVRGEGLLGDLGCAVGGIAGSLLNFLAPATNAPGLVTDTVRFYAVVGQNRSDSIYYRPATGQSDSVRFVYFDVPAGALITNVNGDTLAQGDSLQITMYLADSANMSVGFQPSGLQFSSTQPASIVLSYAWANPLSLPMLQSLLGIWYQEQSGGNWFCAPSSVQIPAQTVTGSVNGFSVYASAY